MIKKKKPEGEKKTAKNKQVTLDTMEQLTFARKKLLDAMLDPANRMKSIIKLCEIADISRGVYYKAMKDPAFVAELKERSLEVVIGFIPSSINALGKKAASGDIKAISIVLEMAGMHSNRISVDVPNAIKTIATTEEEEEIKRSQLVEKMKG